MLKTIPLRTHRPLISRPRLRAAPVAVFLLAVSAAHAGPPPGDQFPQATTAPTSVERHGAWTALLERYAGGGRVDYRGLASDKPRLEAYLRQLAATRREAFARWSRSDRIAFWINAYNAYTVSMILDHYPVESIWNVTPLWKRPLGGPFKLKLMPLGHLAPSLGRPLLSLDDVEHGILRGIYGERRVHFAVVCASRGCPPLRSEAYEGPTLDEQLDAATRGFLADRAKNRYDASTNTLVLSPIFRWFSEDFQGEGGVVGWFRRFGPVEAARKLGQAGPPAIRYSEYDWSLNER
ncbi:MAG: DUF547 domain-containing protein [Deltaproteobacteria bacterium]|nr:MAG: DUF547 domain-containing protein [Deltaproteobacteria bacterium]